MGLLRITALDLRSLALLRIGIAVLLLADLADRALYLREHYSDAGILPRAALALSQGLADWSLHMASGSVAGQAVLFAVAALFATMLLVGWHTRAAAVASFVLLVSLQNRDPAVCYGADALLRALLFFALFLPLGARFSVDERFGGAGGPPMRPDAHQSVAAAALTIQIAMVYVFTGLLKLPDPSWRNLTAVYFAVNAEHHATYFGLWLGRSLAVTQALSFATLILELCLPWLLFIPLARDRVRLALIAVFVAFHVGTACCLHLGYFPWVSALAWLVFLPASFWERARSLTRPGIDPARRPFAAAGAALACFVVLLSNMATVVPGAKLPRPVQRLARAVSMEQHWVMFIRPLHNGWFVAPATLGTGDVVDVLSQGAPLSWEKPVHGADQFPNMRWRKFITDLAWERPQSVKNRALFAQHICNTWNDNIGDSDKRMVSVDLVFMEQDVDTSGAFLPIVRRTLAHRDCIAERDDTSDSAAFYAEKPAPPTSAPAAPEDAP